MSKFTQGEWKYLDELYQVCAYTDTEEPGLLADITGEIGCKGFSTRMKFTPTAG